MLSLGKETTVSAAGKSWTLSRLTLGVIEAVRDWIAKEIGDPFEDLERFIDRLSPEAAAAELAAAKAVRDQLKSFSLDCPLAQRFLRTERGAAQLVLELLRKNHPKATLSDALDLVMELGQERLAETLARAQGELPATAPNGVTAGTPSAVA